jgi:hypothetical protein
MSHWICTGAVWTMQATVLDADDLKALQSFEPDDCKHDGWYECCGGSQPSIPSCGKSD